MPEGTYTWMWEINPRELANGTNILCPSPGGHLPLCQNENLFRDNTTHRQIYF